MLPPQARVDLGAMAEKVYSAFLKSATLLEPQHQIFSVIFRTLVGGGSYPSAEMPSVYSTVPADCAMRDTRWNGVLSLSRDAVRVFYNSPADWVSLLTLKNMNYKWWLRRLENYMNISVLFYEWNFKLILKLLVLILELPKVNQTRNNFLKIYLTI